MSEVLKASRLNPYIKKIKFKKSHIFNSKDIELTEEEAVLEANEYL